MTHWCHCILWLNTTIASITYSTRCCLNVYTSTQQASVLSMTQNANASSASVIAHHTPTFHTHFICYSSTQSIKITWCERATIQKERVENGSRSLCDVIITLHTITSHIHSHNPMLRYTLRTYVTYFHIERLSNGFASILFTFLLCIGSLWENFTLRRFSGLWPNLRVLHHIKWAWLVYTIYTF